MSDRKGHSAPSIDPVLAQARAARLRQTLATGSESQKVFVDFDHTLFLANSTEAFLAAARPSILFALLLKLFGAAQPWAMAGPNGRFVWRDAVRVGLVLILAPWTVWLFSQRAPAIFRTQINARLDDILARVPAHQIVIVSFGLRFVLRALLKGSRYEDSTLVAPQFFELPASRRHGKIAMIERAGLAIRRNEDVVITDSAKDDADILGAAQASFVIRWPEQIETGAFETQYLPFFYTAKVKRSPGFLIRQVFLEELPIVILAFGFAQGLLFDVSRLAALTLLFLSAFLVYEIGYAENDRVGAATEAKPKLGKHFARYADYRMEPDAWLWALVFAAAAFITLGAIGRETAAAHIGLDRVVSGEWTFAALMAAWFAVLILLRAVFGLFNAVRLEWRVFAYLPLHIVKYLAPVVFFSITAAGLALVAAQIVRTWSMYAVRRAGGDEMFLPSQFIRLCFFIMLVPVIFVAQDRHPAQADWPILIMLAFCIVRAIPEGMRKLGTEKHAAEASPSPVERVPAQA